MQTITGAGTMARFLGSAVIVGWLFAGVSLAQEQTPAVDHPIVMRISADVLNSLVDSTEVDREMRIQDVILGTSVFGTAQVNGEPGIKLTNCADKAKFWITLRGTVNSRTTGYNGPAVIYSRSITTFTATRLVTFEPDKGFTGSPAQVNTSTRTIIDGIGSTRGGLIGRIVRRRASRMEASQHDLVQEIVRQRVASRIRNTFHKQSDLRLAKMNEAVDLRKLAQVYQLPLLTQDVKWFCSTTSKYLQLATQAGNGRAIDLPVNDPANSQPATIEIWLHESLVGPQFAAGLELLKLQAEKSKLGLTIATAVRLMNIDADRAERISSLLAEKPIQLHKVQGWSVAKLEMPPREIAKVVQGMQPETIANGTAKLAPSASQSMRRQSGQPNVAMQQSFGQSPSTLLSRTSPALPPVEQSKALDNSPSTEARVWTSGPYTAEARFIALDGNTVRLRRTSGVNTKIRFDLLSAEDQRWIRRYLASQPLTAGIPPLDQN